MPDPAPSIMDNMPDAPETVVAPAPEQDPVVVNPHASALAGIVNKDGVQKFSSVEEALGSINHANAHISRLEEENAKYRESGIRDDAAKEILEKLSAKTAPEAPPAPPVVDDARIAEVVAQQLTAKEKADLVKNNQRIVANRLLEVYSNKEKVNEALDAKAIELGVSRSFLDSVSAQSPKALFSYFGIDAKVETQLPGKVQSSLTTEQFPKLDTPKKKDIMYGATSDEIVSEWRRHKPE